MILLSAAATLFVFGGVPFGANEALIHQKVASRLLEEHMPNGDIALSTNERIAGRDAKRTWLIRNRKFDEGSLVFDFDGDQAGCHQLQQSALSSIESNYGVAPRLDSKNDTGPRGLQSELWIVNLAGGVHIEQRYLYVPIIGHCTVSGRYFASVEGSTAF